MYGPSGAMTYRQTDVLTADPKRLVLMCYEGAIRHLRIAAAAYHTKDYEAKAEALDKVQAIMGVLAGALDFEKGGQIAQNLSALYTYMMRRITETDLRADVRGIDEVIHMLEELKEAWQAIFHGKSEQEVSPSSSHAYCSSAGGDVGPGCGLVGGGMRV